MSDTKNAQAIEILDTVMVALAALPAVITAATALYAKLKSGEEVTQDELDALQARIEARNDRIQAL